MIFYYFLSYLLSGCSRTHHIHLTRNSFRFILTKLQWVTEILLLYCSTAFLPFLQQGCYTFYTYKCYKPKIHCYIIITLHTFLSFKEAKRRKESNYIFIVLLIFLSFLAFLFVPVDLNHYLESFPQPNAALFRSTSLVLLLENIFHVYML